MASTWYDYINFYKYVTLFFIIHVYRLTLTRMESMILYVFSTKKPTQSSLCNGNYLCMNVLQYSLIKKQYFAQTFQTMFLKVSELTPYKVQDSILVWLKSRNHNGYHQDSVLYLKTEEGIVIQKFSPTMEINPFITEILSEHKPSSVVFLFVEYCHFSMKEPIELKIPEEYYLDENDLFFPAFLYQMLEAQNKPYHFDMEYELHILDENVNMLSLRYDQYIHLSKDTYKIVSSSISPIT